MSHINNELQENIEQLRLIIKAANNIVFLGGAGVSTASGIPDFRSEDGIYRTKKLYGHPPEKIISRSFFHTNTPKFYDFYRNELVFQEKEANLAHKALTELEAVGKLKWIITQNIDGLHQSSGSINVLELHGSIYRNYCVKCRKAYDLDFIMASISEPRCIECGGIVKPDVVLYEEGLDDQILDQSVKAVSEADVFIIGGTSLNVYPAAGLIRYFKGKHIVLINKGQTPFDSDVDLLIRGDIGYVLAQAIGMKTD